ncbi:unnamed protein product [Closterium sp. NIES-64]|nr:unnamed protein product [Closterium sp. NIES-64]
MSIPCLSSSAQRGSSTASGNSVRKASLLGRKLTTLLLPLTTAKASPLTGTTPAATTSVASTPTAATTTATAATTAATYTSTPTTTPSATAAPSTASTAASTSAAPTAPAPLPLPLWRLPLEADAAPTSSARR